MCKYCGRVFLLITWARFNFLKLVLFVVHILSHCVFWCWQTSLYPGRRTGILAFELECVVTFLLKSVGRHIGRSVWLSVLLGLSLLFLYFSLSRTCSIPEIKIRMLPHFAAPIILTPGNAVLTNLIVTDMVNVSDAFYAVRIFVAAFTRAPVRIPVVGKFNLVKPSRSVTRRSSTVIFCPLYLDLVSGFFLSLKFSEQMPLCISQSLSCVLHVLPLPFIRSA